MTGKTAAVTAMVLMVGLTVAFLDRPMAALGQKQEKGQVWEYKVIASSPSFAYEKAKDEHEMFVKAGEGLTREYDKLGAAGWEMVGPVFSQNGNLRNDPYRALVVFKRLKK